MKIICNKHIEDYQHLVEGIGFLLAESQKKAAYAINNVMVDILAYRTIHCEI